MSKTAPRSKQWRLLGSVRLGPRTETVMDLHNNYVGAGAASDHDHWPGNACCQDAISALINSGALWYLDKDYGNDDSDEDALLQPTNKP